MKIVIATPIYPPQIGGPATYAHALKEKFPAMGIEVVVVNFAKLMHLPRLIRHYRYYQQLCEALKSADLLLALDPVSTGFPALYAARRMRKPLIVKVVGDYAWEQGQQRHGIHATLDEFIDMERVPLQVQIFRYIQTTVAKEAQRVIVPSGYLKNIVAAWGIPREKIEVIYNAVPLVPLGTVPSAIRALPRPRIVTAARLVPWKRIDGIIDAVALLRASGTPASLAVVGDGPERSFLEERASEKLREGYVFTGSIPHADILKTIADAEVFALNSEYEGLSHTLIEALSVGAPTVTTPAGGNPEIVRDGENGILVPPGDVPALADALSRFLVDADERALFSARAKESASRFSAETMLVSTANLLQRYARP